MKKKLAVYFIFAFLSVLFAEETVQKKVHALTPAKMAVKAEAGEAVFPDGSRVKFSGAELVFAGPEVKQESITEKTPGNYDKGWEEWGPWDKKNAIVLKPKVDSLMLGALQNGVLPDSVMVSGGGKTFKKDEDYKLSEEFGSVANLGDKLGKKGEGEIKVDYKYVPQRIDLVQAGKDGKLSVKKGVSAVVCPMIPDPDAGCAGVAGVYIYTVNHPMKFIVTGEDIFEIKQVKPVLPVNKDGVKNTLEKLKAKKDISIAFVGDSVTLGAEAGEWWSDRSKTYTGLIVSGIKKKFGVKITEVPGYAGGGDTAGGVKLFSKDILPKKPDLVFIAFGLNDANGGKSNNPRITPGQYKKNILTMVKKAKEAGMDVILISPLQGTPFLGIKFDKTLPKYVEKLNEVAKEENVGFADVNTEWLNMADKGIPPYSQLHNWMNHPGTFGHALYADVVLKFF